MPVQILDATLVAAPKQRNTNAEKADLRARRISEDWKNKPAKLFHKDRHVRWTLKFAKAKRQDDGTIPLTEVDPPLQSTVLRLLHLQMFKLLSVFFPLFA